MAFAGDGGPRGARRNIEPKVPDSKAASVSSPKLDSIDISAPAPVSPLNAPVGSATVTFDAPVKLESKSKEDPDFEKHFEGALEEAELQGYTPESTKQTKEFKDHFVGEREAAALQGGEEVSAQTAPENTPAPGSAQAATQAQTETPAQQAQTIGAPAENAQQEQSAPEVPVGDKILRGMEAEIRERGQEKREKGEVRPLTPEALAQYRSARTEALEREAGRFGPRAVESVRKVGEWYAKQPLWKKLAVSGAILGTSATASALGGAAIGSVLFAAAITGSAVNRTLAASAAFVGGWKVSEWAHNKVGSDPRKQKQLRHALAGAGSAVLVFAFPTIMEQTGAAKAVADSVQQHLSPVGKFLLKALGASSAQAAELGTLNAPGAASTLSAQASERVTQELSSVASTAPDATLAAAAPTPATAPVAPAAIEAAAAAAQPQFAQTVSVEKGGSLWSATRNSLPTTLTAAQRENMTANIVEWLKGQGVDMNKPVQPGHVLTLPPEDVMQRFYDRALRLTPAEVANISQYPLPHYEPTPLAGATPVAAEPTSQMTITGSGAESIPPPPPRVVETPQTAITGSHAESIEPPPPRAQQPQVTARETIEGFRAESIEPPPPGYVPQAGVPGAAVESIEPPAPTYMPATENIPGAVAEGIQPPGAAEEIPVVEADDRPMRTRPTEFEQNTNIGPDTGESVDAAQEDDDAQSAPTPGLEGYTPEEMQAIGSLFDNRYVRSGFWDWLFPPAPTSPEAMTTLLSQPVENVLNPGTNLGVSIPNLGQLQADLAQAIEQNPELRSATVGDALRQVIGAPQLVE